MQDARRSQETHTKCLINYQWLMCSGSLSPSKTAAALRICACASLDMSNMRACSAASSPTRVPTCSTQQSLPTSSLVDVCEWLCRITHRALGSVQIAFLNKPKQTQENRDQFDLSQTECSHAANEMHYEGWAGWPMAVRVCCTFQILGRGAAMVLTVGELVRLCRSSGIRPPVAGRVCLHVAETVN
jgi:hypothetical protein